MVRVGRRTLLSSTAIGIALGIFVGPAAAAPETYVSAFGRDGGSCSRMRPCRTFAAALAVTDPAGTILALDSGTFSFRYLSVVRSVTIAAAPGVRAVLRPASDAAVFVNAGASDTVTLRGLTFVAPAGAATPFNGIVYNPGAAALYVENCTIVGFPTKGMLVLNHGRLVVRDTVVRGGVVGISLDAPVRPALENVTITDSEFGLLSGLGAQASIRNSVITGNGVGLLADALLGTLIAELSIEDCLITHNQTGIEVRPPTSTARLSNSTVTNNGIGVNVSGGVLETRGNNTVRGNGTNVSGSLTPISGD
jgi:hypothetical protein